MSAKITGVYTAEADDEIPGVDMVTAEADDEIPGVDDLTTEGWANKWRRLDQWRSSKQVKETWPVKVEQMSEGDLTQKSAANVVCKVKHANER